MKYDNAELQQIKRIRRDLERALRPYRENTEPGLAVLAAVQVARLIVQNYSKKDRRELIEQVVIPFLRDETKIIEVQ